MMALTAPRYVRMAHRLGAAGSTRCPHAEREVRYGDLLR